MSTQEERQKKFEEYDFEGNPQWKEFIEKDLKGEIPPNADQKVLTDIKKLWYKQVVDPEFETGIDLKDIPEEKNQQQQQQQQNDDQKQQQPKNEKKPPKLMLFFFHLENICKAIVLTSNLMFPRICHYITFFVCIMAIGRQLKRPRWNKEYGAKFIRNEFTHNLAYMIPFSIFSHAQNIVYFFPLMIHFWLGLCEYLNLQQGFIYEKGKKFIDRTRENKIKLLLMKSKVEIYMVGFHFFMIFAWSFFFTVNIQQNILLMVFYVNFLRVKYMISPNLQYAFQELNEWGVKTFEREDSHRLVKWTYGKIRQFCVYMVTYDKKIKQQEQQQQQKQQ